MQHGEHSARQQGREGQGGTGQRELGRLGRSLSRATDIGERGSAREWRQSLRRAIPPSHRTPRPASAGWRCHRVEVEVAQSGGLVVASRVEVRWYFPRLRPCQSAQSDEGRVSRTNHAALRQHTACAALPSRPTSGGMPSAIEVTRWRCVGQGGVMSIHNCAAAAVKVKRGRGRRGGRGNSQTSRRTLSRADRISRTKEPHSEAVAEDVEEHNNAERRPPPHPSACGSIDSTRSTRPYGAQTH